MGNAVEIAYQAFEYLKFDFPRDDAKIGQVMMAEIAELAEKLGDDPIKVVNDLPVLTDQRAKNLLKIMINSTPGFFMAKPAAFGLVALKMVKLSLEYGNAPESCYGYSVYAILLVQILQQYSRGFLFSKLAIDLSKKFNDDSFLGPPLLICGGCVSHFCIPFHESIVYLEDAFPVAVSSGDTLFAGFDAYHHSWMAYEIGDDLSSSLPLMQKYLDFTKRVKFDGANLTIQSFFDMIQALKGDNDALENNKKCLKALTDSNFGNGIGYNMMCAQVIHFFSEDHVQSLVVAKSVEALAAGMGIFLTYFIYRLYRSLSMSILGFDHPAVIANGFGAETYESDLQYFKTLSESCPETFLHRYQLLLAQKQSMEGDVVGACRSFDAAVSNSQDSKLWMDHALCLELASVCYREAGFLTAGKQFYFSARNLYSHLGNNLKLRSFVSPFTFKKPTSVLENDLFCANFNMQALIKVSKMMSEELGLENLSNRILGVLIEEANALFGVLVLFHPDSEDIRFRMTARSDGNGDIHTKVLKEYSSDELSPMNMLMFVKRTGDSIQICCDDEKHEFYQDRYFIANPVKSALATPLFSRGELVAIVYLENALLENAFTDERLSVVHMLGGQMATALENAALFTDLNDRVASRTKELEMSNIELAASQRELDHAQSIARMGSFLESSNVGGRVIWSKELCRIHRVSENSGLHIFMEEYISRFVFPQDQDYYRQSVNKFIGKYRTSQSSGYESLSFRITVPSTEYTQDVVKAVEMTFSMEISQEDGGIRNAYGTLQDISERNKETQEREKFVSLVENSMDLVCMSCRDTDVISYINQSGVKVLGLDSADDCIGRSLGDLFANSTSSEHQGWLSSDTPQWQGECSLVNQITNRTVPVIRHSFSITDPRYGHIIAIATICKDISTMKAFEGQLITAKEMAIDASKMKSEFLANMSHEIRTPLAGVIGMADFLLESSLNEEQQEYANSISRSSNALLSVINDILDFSKVEAGKMQIECIPFDLGSLVSDVEKILGKEIVRKKLSLRIDIQQGMGVYYFGDPNRLRQILLNLMGNAIKFTSEGEISLKVCCKPSDSCDDDADADDVKNVMVAVTDSGIGIDEVGQAKLFQSFSQADSSTSRKYGGSGLGLAICKHLVTLQKGEIGCISTLGQGATFWFNIPMKVCSRQMFDSQGIGSQDYQVTPADEENLKKMRVLVAEDNEVNGKIVSRMLSKIGVHFELVLNGKEVLDALRRAEFDVILMDCQMPEMDGYEATKHIRFDEEFSRIKDINITALTANAMQSDRDKCKMAGMDQFLSKPMKFNTLRLTLLQSMNSQP